jgi:hypothetical protein
VLRHLLLQPCQFPRHRLPLPLKGVVSRRNLLHQLANGCLRLFVALLQLPQVLHALVDLGLKVLQQLALVAVRPPIQQLCGTGGSGRRQWAAAARAAGALPSWAWPPLLWTYSITNISCTCQELVLDFVVQKRVLEAAELALQPPRVCLAHRLRLLHRALLNGGEALPGRALQQF